jgi:hypothetical protein
MRKHLLAVLRVGFLAPPWILPALLLNPPTAVEPPLYCTRTAEYMHYTHHTHSVSRHVNDVCQLTWTASSSLRSHKTVPVSSKEATAQALS